MEPLHGEQQSRIFSQQSSSNGFFYSAIFAPLKVFGLTLPSGAVWSDGETFWLGWSAVHRSSHILPLAVGDSHQIFQHVVRGNIPRWMHHERGGFCWRLDNSLVAWSQLCLGRWDAGKHKLGATCLCYYDVISPASRWCHDDNRNLERRTRALSVNNVTHCETWVFVPSLSQVMLWTLSRETSSMLEVFVSRYYVIHGR